MTQVTAVQTQRLLEPRSDSLQMTEIEVAHAVASDAIAAANQHLIKGTTGTYGFVDAVRFKFRAFLSSFITLDSKETKQLFFYQQFQELKSALKTPSKNIKDSYDRLVSIARSHATIDGADSVLLTILNEELSKETTEALLQQIRLQEGSKIATSMTDFTHMFDETTNKAVLNNYGTKEQVEHAFCQAAVQSQNHDPEMAAFLAQVEREIKEFAQDSFVSDKDTNTTLEKLCDQLGNHMLGDQKITKELLEKIHHNGIPLIHGMKNPEAFAEKLEQLRSNYSDPRIAPELNRQCEALEYEVLAKEAELEIDQSYKVDDIIEFIGDLDVIPEKKELIEKTDKLEKLKEELRAEQNTLNQTILNEKLLLQLPQMRQKLKDKENQLADLKKTPQLFAKLEELLVRFQTVETLKREAAVILEEQPLPLLSRMFYRMDLWSMDVEVRQFRDDLQKEHPNINIDEVFARLCELQQDIPQLKSEIADVPTYEADGIERIPTLKAAILEKEAQIQELTLELETGNLLRQLPLIKNKKELESLTIELEAQRKDLQQAKEKEVSLYLLTHKEKSLAEKEQPFKELQNKYQELLPLFQQIAAIQEKSDTLGSRPQGNEENMLFDKMEREYPRINPTVIYFEFYVLYKQIKNLKTDIASIIGTIPENTKNIPEIQISIKKIEERINKLKSFNSARYLDQEIEQTQVHINYKFADKVLLKLPRSADVSIDNPVLKAYTTAQQKMDQLTAAKAAFLAGLQKYDQANAVHKKNGALPAVGEAWPLKVTSTGLVADTSIQEFATEIGANVAHQTAKKRYLKSLEIACRVCNVRADEEVQAFEKSVNQMDPLLRSAFGSRLDPAALKPNTHQLQMKICKDLTQHLNNRYMG